MKFKLLVFSLLALTLVAFSLMRPKGNPENSPGPSTELIAPITPEETFAIIARERPALTLINFWASWCEPCKVEMPYILALRQSLASRGLKVLIISIDEPRDLPEANAFLRQQHVDFQTFYKGTQPVDFVSRLYPKWEGAVPATLLIDSQLKILEAWEGDASLKEFTERVSNHLK